uniref:Uncharacterized protein LOC114914519 n=1 Tax=Elaeis guineensis var. tenera TaxID=51953 RepID=A0A8N4IFU4_ELAGV|nr:uncharacterized protein LOC114914519 [Elaeis guineensis]
MRLTSESLRQAIRKKKNVLSGPGGPSQPSKKLREESPPRVSRSTPSSFSPQPPPVHSSPLPAVEVVMVAAPPPPADDDVIVVEPPARPIEAVQALSIQIGSGGGQAPSRKGANKGKSLMPPTFTTDYNLDMSSKEATVAIKMRFKVTDQTL